MTASLHKTENNAPVVLITGCSSGFGKRMALAFAEIGATVIASVRDKAGANSLMEEASAKNLTLEYLELDVCDDRSIDTAVNHIAQRFGRLDVLINNAGIAIDGTVECLPQQDFAKIMETNFWGSLAMTRAVLPMMRAQRSGVIIMMSSLSALVGLPCDGAYAASKAALERVSESLYTEVRRFGICVRIIQPGAFNTRLQARPSASSERCEPDYKPLLQSLTEHRKANVESGDDPSIVVKAVLAAAFSKDNSLYFPVGVQACAVADYFGVGESDIRERRLEKAAGVNWWLQPEGSNEVPGNSVENGDG